MDHLDFRYKDLREQLYTLGFHQQLPIGSMSIVSALVEDLIKVTNSYKQSKETVNNLLEEKRAWDLGIEPYKCDNSRLLSENNALHLEVIQQRGLYEKKILDLKGTIRNLEVDKNYLDDHCFELVSKISEMEHHGRSSKSNDGGKVKHKKTFVSTVHSGIPPYTSSSKYQSSSRRSEAKCSTNDHQIQIVILQNENQLLKDEINSLKKQLDSRDMEIARLHKQLSGGRPVAALGRDCCYQGIDTLTEDMKLLQQQLIATKKQLSESLEQQHEAKLRAIKLDEEKRKYAKELKDMEELALKFQDDANAQLVDKGRDYEHLVDKLNESLRKISILEAATRSSSSTSQQSKMVENMKAALKKANDENDNLIDRLVNDEQKYSEEIKILARKNSKLEEKLQLLQSKGSSDKRSKGTITESQHENGFSKEKLLLQTEYLRRLNQPVYERELENVQSELAMREMEIDKLKEQLYELQSQPKTASGNHTSISVQSAMSRMEREAEMLKSKINHITSERDDLKQNLKEVLDEQHNEQLSYTTQILKLTDQIKQLDNDNQFLRGLQQTGASNESRIFRMTEKLDEYTRQLEELSSENRKLKSSYNQIKILQEQTEKTLIDYQNRLVQAENNLAHSACEQGAMDAKFTFTSKTISNLKEEADKLKDVIKLLENDRSDMHNQLDTKTEQLIHMDTEVSKLRSENAELNSKSVALRRQMSSKSNESVEKTSTIQKVTQESEILRKQVEHFKLLNENLTAENSRLCLQINDLTCACKELKKKQELSAVEVNRLKDSVKEYVFKIKEVEDTLALKNAEYDRIIGDFNAFENEAKELEKTNHSLESENEEASRRLRDADREIHHLQEILNERDNEIAANDRQITELNNQLIDVERELKRRDEQVERVQANSNANKELCNKLDIEKEKLKDELNECSDIRRKLERENEKLRKDLAANEVLDQQGAVQKLQELLTASKVESEQQRATLSEKSTEIQKLRAKLNELKEKYAEEQENCKRYQGLAQENSVQVQELNRKLTNYRYDEASKVSKEKEQRDDYDRNKILLEQAQASKYSDLIYANSELESKNPTSNPRADLTEPPVTIYRRTPLSAIEPSTINGKRRTSRLDYSESSEEINSTKNSYIMQSQHKKPSMKGKNDRLRRGKKTSSSENGPGTSKGTSMANELDDRSGSLDNRQSENISKPDPKRISIIDEVNDRIRALHSQQGKNRDEVGYRRLPTASGFNDEFKVLINQQNGGRDDPVSRPFLEANADHARVSFGMKKNETISKLPDDITPRNIQTTMNSESREEFFTCDSSSTVPHIGHFESPRTQTFDTSRIPPPPPMKDILIGYRSNDVATFNIQVDSRIGQIHAFRGDCVIDSNK